MADEALQTKVGKERILHAKPEELTKSFLEDLFASYHDRETNTYKESPFKTTDVILLTKADYPFLKEEKIQTTLGKLYFNRYCLELPGVIEHIGFWNEPITAKGLEKLTSVVNDLVILDKIDTKTLGEYIDARDRLGFWSAGFLSTSISSSLVRPMPDVEKRKKELFHQYEKELNSDNAYIQISTSGKIEKELMGMVVNHLKDDYGYDLYASGDGNLNNNYKTINVMRGAVFNQGTGKYDIVENSLMNGIKKQDIPAFSNSVLEGAYPSAVGTAEAGYLAKIFLALLQSERIDPNPDSDCGTEVTIPLTVTKKVKPYVIYRYINDNGKKVLLTIENVDKYVDKTVRLYSPQCCLKDPICGKCAGRVFHNMGVTNVGLLTTPITQKLLNLKLKSKHDLSQSAGAIPDKFIFLHPDAKQYFKTDEGVLVNKVKMKLYIPRLLEEIGGFVRETTNVVSMAVFPVRFLDKNDQPLLATMMLVPAMLYFNIYSEIQEDPEYYIISYEPDSEITNLGINKKYTNCEFFMNQIYMNSKSPQLPYSLMTEMMFRCLEINGTDFTGPSISYELLARRVCRNEKGQPFAFDYGRQKGVDPMSYKKLRFREAVQGAGVLQGVLFQDISNSMVKGLSQTLNGKEPTPTPLETVIKA